MLYRNTLEEGGTVDYGPKDTAAKSRVVLLGYTGETLNPAYIDAADTDYFNVGAFYPWRGSAQSVSVHPVALPPRDASFYADEVGAPTDQSDAGSVGIFPQQTNQMQEAWVYSHNGPIRRRKRG